jgi:predicted nucleotidyltransferase
MPNPRYLTEEGEPSVELLKKLSHAKRIYFRNLEQFCDKYVLETGDFRDIRNVFLIGSHATDKEWDDSTSDLDFKLVNPSATPEYLWKYKKEILDPQLCIGEKKRWIDLFFAREVYQVLLPRWELVNYWNKDI